MPAAADVWFAVFDVTGRRVRMLVDARQEPGEYELRWDGRDDRGLPAASGVYFTRFVAGPYSGLQRLVRIE